MVLDASTRHANPMGTLHGGVICDVADAAMGCARLHARRRRDLHLLDLTVKFFKPIWNARIKAAARLIRRTRTLAFIECEVADESGSLVAKLFSSCMILRGQEAKGR